MFKVVSLGNKALWLCVSPALVLKNHLWLKVFVLTVTGGDLPSVKEKLQFRQEIASILEVLWFNFKMSFYT